MHRSTARHGQAKRNRPQFSGMLLAFGLLLCLACLGCGSVDGGDGGEALGESGADKVYASEADGSYSPTVSQVAAACRIAAAYADEYLDGDAGGLSLGAPIPVYDCRSLDLSIAGTVNAERANADLIPLCRDGKLIGGLSVSKDEEGEYETWCALDASCAELFGTVWDGDSEWCQLSVADWAGRPGTNSVLCILTSEDATLAYYTDSKGELVVYDGLQEDDLASVEDQLGFSATGRIAELS